MTQTQNIEQTIHLSLPAMRFVKDIASISSIC